MIKKIQLKLFLILLIIGVQGGFTDVSAINPLVDFTWSGFCVGSPTVFTVDNVKTIVSNRYN